MTTLPRVFLDPKRESTVRRGHPWIFPKALLHMDGTPQTGEMVQVCGKDGSLLAIGIWNAHSLYRVRVLALRSEFQEIPTLEMLVRKRLEDAIALRRSLQLPSPQTTAFRLFNSEGDGLSGLVIDCFADTWVVSTSALWVEQHREWITRCIQACGNPQTLLWKPQAKPLQQDGWDMAEAIVQPVHQVDVLENGVTFSVDFSVSQKTGLFLDQRENHIRMGALAHGKRVLDLYTCTGGFALHAAKQGAQSVVAVDSSEPAIAMARENAAKNGFGQIEWVRDDARNWLARAGEFDVIILDPPKLVPSRQHLERARNYYRFLHREVFRAMRPGTLLLTCNCSSALTRDDFVELVSLQAVAVGKQARIHGVYGPAACHSTLAFFPEGQYLGAILISV